MPKKKNPTTGKPSKSTSFPYDFTKPNYLDVPTKPIDVEKPINKFDYLNALARIPEVQKDLMLLVKEPTKEKELELINKYWGILGFSPKLLENTKALPDSLKKYLHNSKAIHVFSNWEKEPRLGGIWEHDPLSKYRDGRHVILAVDITKKGIVKDFVKLLERIKKDYNIPKDKTRNKDTVKEIWEIYDYKTKDKLSFLKIAKRLSGLNGNPAYNPRLDACLQMVRRAYYKAEEIVKAVKREVSKVITENAEKAEKQKTADTLMKMYREQDEEQRKKGYPARADHRPVFLSLLLAGMPDKTKDK